MFKHISCASICHPNEIHDLHHLHTRDHNTYTPTAFIMSHFKSYFSSPAPNQRRSRDTLTAQCQTGTPNSSENNHTTAVRPSLRGFAQTSHWPYLCPHPHSSPTPTLLVTIHKPNTLPYLHFTRTHNRPPMSTYISSLAVCCCMHITCSHFHFHLHLCPHVPMWELATDKEQQ